MCKAFRENRTHHRSHFKVMLNDLLKPIVLDKWPKEVEYHQRVLYELMQEFEYLDYYDKDIWQKVFDTMMHKKRINNMTLFTYFVTTMQKMNADPKNHFFKKLDKHLDHF